MADPLRDQDYGGAHKRPAQTIEGTATEVKMESAVKDEMRAEAEPEPAPGEEEASVEAESLPPPRTTLPELKSFMTHLAAGLLGGLIGVLALAFAWGGPSGGKQTIASLEIGKLQQRITALEGTAKEAPPELSDLSSRVAQLESSLKSLAETAQDGGSVASAAAISQQITEAEQRLDAKIADVLSKGGAGDSAAVAQLQSELSELKAKVAALAELGTSESTALTPALAALSERIAKLEASLPKLADTVGKETASVKSAAVAIAFANLRAAVTEGRPYAAELDTIATLAPGGIELGVLPAYAEKGIPTVPELARSFAATRESLVAAAPKAGDGSLMGSLMASAQSLVKIRRLDEPAGDRGEGGVLGRAQAALDKGDLAGAVQEVETLQGAERDPFAGWLGQAHARLSADDTLTRLEGVLLVSIGDTDQAPQP